MFKKMTMHQRRSLLAAAALMFAYGLANNTLGFFVTPVTQSLGSSRAAFNFYYTIMSIVSLVIAPVFGQLLNRVKVGKIVLAGCVVGALCFLAFSFCRVMPMFYLVAFFLGIVQNGCTSVTAVVIIHRAFTEDSGTATGFAMAGTGICSLIMSLILPSFIGALGWAAGYQLQAILWAVMTFAAVLLTRRAAVDPSSPTAPDTADAEGQGSGATFSQAMHSPRLFVLITVVILLNMAMIFSHHMPAFFIEMGCSATLSGMIMGVFSVFLIICKIGLGTLFDKIGAKRTTLIAFFCFASGLWFMLFGNTPLLCLGAAFSAFGMASSTVLVPLVTKRIFGTRDFAPIWSIISMATVLGCALGSPAWGMVYDFLGTYKPAVIIVPFIVIADGLILVRMMSDKRAVIWEDK